MAEVTDALDILKTITEETTVEQLLALAGAERRAKPRTRNRSKATATRSPANTDALIAKLLPMLKAAPKGVSGEAIKKELGLSRGAWRSVMRAGLASGAMRKKGDKRATLYFAGTKRTK